MTGPEHYVEAERLQESLDVFDATDPEQQPLIMQVIAEAQVHATLAQAAATAFAADMTAGEWPGWRDAAGSANTRADAAGGDA